MSDAIQNRQSKIQNGLSPQRNLVPRLLDGRTVNVARFRGNLFYCRNACCCGRIDLKNAPVPADRYHEEWMARRLRNFVHLTESGCLGPCALANVAMLVFDGQSLWFHSMNEDADVAALFDYIEDALAADILPLPGGRLADRQFTANSWQPRPDGQAIDDARPWHGRDARPDPTPACELPADAFIPSDYACEVRDAEADDPVVATAIAAMEGAAALPRTNGELVFAEPWQGRAFGMAVSLHEQGLFEWERFRQRLIARIAEAEGGPAPFEYYRCWLAALEDVLEAAALVSPSEATERAYEFEFGERQDMY